eukprot:5936783-Amphidinium_carterae.1
MSKSPAVGTAFQTKCSFSGSTSRWLLDTSVAVSAIKAHDCAAVLSHVAKSAPSSGASSTV